MDNTTYEKLDDGTLAETATQTTKTTYDVNELKQRRDRLVENLALMQGQFDESIKQQQEQISMVDSLLAKAAELGITID